VSVTGIPLDMLHDCRDATRVNSVVNDQHVRPFIGMPELGELDFGPVLENPANIFPFGDHGGFALIWSSPFTYEVHTFILKSGRGPWARLAAAGTINLAAQRGAQMLWTRVPQNELPHVRAFAVEMGMKPTGETAPFGGKDYEVLSMKITPCPQ